MSQPYSPQGAVPGHYVTPVSTFEKDAIACPVPALFLAAVMFNNGAETLYLCVCNENVIDVDYSYLPPIAVAPGQTGSIDFSNSPIKFTLGIVVRASTDPEMVTLPATDDVFFAVTFAPF